MLPESNFLRLSQKKNGTRTEFVFKDETLQYSIQDKASGTTFTVHYPDIAFDTSELNERNAWFRNVGLLWLILGAVETVYTFSKNGKFDLSIWLIFGAITYALYYFRQTSYTIFDSSKGRILVIKDAQHEKIKSEIENRRRDFLRKKYAYIDPTNEPENEMAKLKWLAEHDVITKEEADDLSVKLQLGIGDDDKFESQ